MATTCLPAIVPSPFGKTFTRKLYKYSDLNQNCSKNVGDRHDDYLRGSPQTPRTVSAPLSSSPAEITNRQEISRTCYYHGRPSTPPSTRACPLNAAHPGARGSIRDALPPAEQTFEQTETFPIFEEDPLVAIEKGFHGLPRDSEANRSSDQSWSWPIHDSAHFPRRVDDGTSNPTEGNLVPPKHEESEVKSASTIIFDNSLGKRAESFRRWASSFRHKRSQHRHHVEPRVMDTKLRAETVPALPPSSLRQKWHQKRISNASSRFVATVKTASLSSDSMSLLPRSRRYSRVSDTRATRTIDPRSSVESRRPSSISSSDEGALRRSIKRRQILREILSSEESYVADLKALHNLFSTLLASMPSISTQTRNSIQRNVAEMLQLHEQMVNELHRIALQATLHEWKAVASPLRTVSRRRGKCQSLHAKTFYASMPKPGDRGFSPDLVNIRDLADSTYGADPAEVAEVARAFKSRIAQFFVYEEYCAKYEIMVQELASSYKMVPQWSSYEAGMEALANSIASLNERGNDNRKALTAGDLLIKPIQRICKYPLFFDDLHKNTPAVDCPTSHVEVDGVLSNLREMVREINMATDDPKARQRIQRRWLLQDRLKLGRGALKTSQFRMLGDVLLCGILYLAYQTKSRVEGGYMLCMMFRDYLVIAAPAVEQSKFDVLATIYLCDARVVSTKDGRGLQCHTALFSWKIVFECDSLLYELMFSACSATEQQQWLGGITRGRSLLALEDPETQPSVPDLFTTTSLELKALTSVFGQAGTLARRLSIQRAATVGTRIATCRVIIKNTHKPQEGQELRPSSALPINRSQSLLTTHHIRVLAPKRSERVRLEQSLADVWTRDTLPYPGMSLTRGGSIIRASAGSLVRKLSLASIHSSFGKRSTSLMVVESRCSHETSAGAKYSTEQRQQTDESLSHEIILGDQDNLCEGKKLSEEIIPPPSTPSRLLFTTTEKLRRGSADEQGGHWFSKSWTERAPRDRPPEVEMDQDTWGVSKKTWRSPFGLLKNLSAEGLRNLLYSSKVTDSEREKSEEGI